MSDTDDGKDTRRYLPEITVFLVVLAAFIITRFIPVCRVSGSSMEGTLHDGELVIIDRDEVDIVVANVVIDGHKENVIKRVVAASGDSISIKGGRLYINGAKYDAPDTAEGYDDIADAGTLNANADSQRTLAYVDNGITYFLMGDNVNHSRDSRYFGTVGASEIKGVVTKVIN